VFFVALGNPKIEDVPVGDSIGDPNLKIHTIFYEASEELQDGIDLTPIVMIHGLGGTAVQFHHNYQELCKYRKVYGIDIPGFGLSSRSTCYEGDPCKECERKMVGMIDRWRAYWKIEDMVMVGHSLGGYVAMVYAMHFKEHVRQLILIEPWGMLTKSESVSLKKDNPCYKQSCMGLRWAIKFSHRFRLKPLTLVRRCGKKLCK